MEKIITTVGNVVSGSARSKETLEWLSNDIFGKVVQIKKGVTIDRDKTSINLNENMDSLVPASKISDMATGWICGQTARDFTKTKTGAGGSMNIQEAEEFKTTKFFLQDRLRHEGDKERGSRVCAPAEVLHLSVEGGTGAHPVQELRTGRPGRKGDDKGRVEQTRGEMRHARTTTAVLLLLCAAATLYGQGKHGGGAPSAALSLYRLPPLERAILCTKYHEGWHGEKKHWPYVGWGHRVLPGERFTNDITRAQGDSILRADLMKLCRLFRRFGRDSTLLSCLAYQVGAYRLLGSKSIPKSRLIQKAGSREQGHLHGVHFFPVLQRQSNSEHRKKRRKVEYMLLFEK